MTDIERIEGNTKIWWQPVSRSRFEPFSSRTLINTSNGDSCRSVLFIDGYAIYWWLSGRCKLQATRLRSVCGMRKLVYNLSIKYCYICGRISTIIGYVRRLSKSDFWLRHICQSVFPPSCTAGIFMKFDILGYLENLRRKLKFY